MAPPSSAVGNTLVSIAVSLLAWALFGDIIGNLFFQVDNARPASKGRPELLGYQPDGTVLVVDRVLEPQTVSHFLEFATHGRLPTGRSVGLATLTPEQAKYLNTPLAEWRPTAHQNDNESFVDKLMHHVGSFSESDNLQVIEKSLHAMKTRLWAGIVPVTRSRWAQKSLGDPANDPAAVEILSQVVEAFKYLGSSGARRSLSSTYNKVYDDLTDASEALNAVDFGENQSNVDLSALWLEYVQDLYLFMATRAHTWVIEHIFVIRRGIMAELTGRPLDATEDEPVQIPDIYEEVAISHRLDKYVEIAAQADYTIMMPMQGYKGFVAPHAVSDQAAVLQSPELEVRRDAYYPFLRKKVERVSWDNIMATAMAQLSRQSDSDQKSDLGDDLSYMATKYRDKVIAQDLVRGEIRGQFPHFGSEIPKLDLETLEMSVHRDNKLQPGFVIYRLTQYDDDASWLEFKQRFELESQLPGIKPHFTWLDGAELQIAEEDFQGAIKHFALFQGDNENSALFESGTARSGFLAVDYASFKSYMFPDSKFDSLPAGDTGSFLVAVSPDFGSQRHGDDINETPGFKGHINILGSLIWSDLYPMLAAQIQGPRDLWSLTMKHPQKLYVGPVTCHQMHAWQKFEIGDQDREPACATSKTY